MEEEIILSTNKCEITKKDIKTLSPHTYLNDAIIAFYYEVIQDKYPNDNIAFLAPAVSQSIILNANTDEDIEDAKQCIFIPLGLNTKKFIFAPINDTQRFEYKESGSHWTLNIVDVDNNKIYYLDSTNGDVDNAHIFHHALEKLFGKKFEFIFALNNRYQTNGYDCGMFLLGFTELAVKHITENGLKIDSKDKKGKYLDYIFKGENLVKQNYMGEFRKNIINLIYKMAKNQ